MTTDNLSITPKTFVKEFRELKDSLITDYFSKDGDISRLPMLQDIGLNESQIETVQAVMNDALEDALYTVLLGLDGCASISRHQVMYQLLDEAGNEITGNIESEAWEQFQNNHSP